MKKVFLSILTIIYMTVSSGMAMEVHFCMGEKTGTDFYSASGNICGNCGMKDRMAGCCHDEQKFIKLSEDQNTASSSYYAPVFFEVVLPSIKFSGSYIDPFQHVSFFNYFFTASGPPLYLSNCVFLI